MRRPNAKPGINPLRRWTRFLHLEHLESRDVPSAVLVADINATPNSGVMDSTFLVPFDNRVMFAANDGTSFMQLWATDGTASGTTRVSSTPVGTSKMTSAAVMNGSLYFGSGNDALWRYDGGSSTPTMVHPIIASGVGSVSNITPVGNRIFFSASATSNNSATGSTYGEELWVSDGTSAGTKLALGDFNPGIPGTKPRNFTVVGDTLYFTGNNSNLTGQDRNQLYAYNLTSNTATNLTNNAAYGNTQPAWVMGFNGEAYFYTNGALRRTDGTTVSLVKTSDGNKPVVAGGWMYFYSNFNTNLVRTNGTVIEDVLAPDGVTFLRPGSLTTAAGALGTDLYFSANLSSKASNTQELYRVTAASNIATLIDLDPAPNTYASPHSFTTVGSKAYFWAGTAATGQELYATDGTTTGLVADITPGGGTPFVTSDVAFVGGSKYYFSFTHPTYGREMWVSDGTSFGTKLLRDVQVGSGSALGNPSFAYPGPVYADANRAYFHANDGLSGGELWTSDGTEAGTVRLETNPSTKDAGPVPHGTVNGKLIFTATTPTTGTEYYATDGTAAGTALLADLNPGSGGTGYTTFATFGGKLVTSNGSSLLATDGTPAGTQLIPISGVTVPRLLGVLGPDLYFVGSNAAEGEELWKWNGTTAGAVLTAGGTSIRPGTGGADIYLTGADDTRIYFRANDGVNGSELWTVDSGGVPALVADLTAGSGGTAIGLSTGTFAGSYFFFHAGNMLARTDGTAAGTKTVAPASTVSLNNSFRMASLNNKAYFQGNSTNHGMELWSSDGNTVSMVGTGISQFTGNGLNSAPFAHNGKIYMAGFDAVANKGGELYVTDGTATPTLVADINPGSANATPGGFYSAPDGKLYFGAANTATGAELYRTDGTSAGTSLVVDLYPGTSSGYAGSIASGPGGLYYSGRTFATGTELFRVSLPSAPTSIALSANTVVENSPAGTVIGTLSATDPDAGDTFTFTLAAGGPHNALFHITGNTLSTTASFDFETLPTATIRVRATDSTGLPFEQFLTVTITNVNEAPRDLAVSPFTLVENAAAGTVVGALSALDDPGDSHTYTLVSGGGDTHNAKFSIVGTQLIADAAFDFETTPTASIRIQAKDQLGQAFEKAVTVTIANVNEAPFDLTFTLDSVWVANGYPENAAAETTMGLLSVSDPDAGSSWTYSIVPGGSDNAFFAIKNNQLRQGVPFDFEAQTSYTVTVRATDPGGLFTDLVVILPVINVNEGPTGVTFTSGGVAEDAKRWSAVGSLIGVDPDAGATFTYELLNDASGRFELFGDQLLLADPRGLDFEIAVSHLISVRVTDQSGLSKIFSVNVNVLDAAEPAAPTTPRSFVNVDGTIYHVTGSNSLMRSTGTGTPALAYTFASPLAMPPMAVNDDLLYLADGASLYRVGPTGSPVLVTTATGPIRELVAWDRSGFDGVAYLAGGKLWRTDTANNTLGYSLWQSADTDYSPRDLVVHNGDLYMSVRDSAKGRELGSVTAVGVASVTVTDLRPGPLSSHPHELSGSGWFAALTSAGVETHHVDGTLRDLVPGPGSSFPSAIAHGYAAATVAAGRELVDLAANTVIDIHAGGSSHPAGFTPHGGHVYFAAEDANGRELWRVSGGAATLVADIVPGSGGSHPAGFVTTLDTLHFNAETAAGRELWRTTGNGATQVNDFVPGGGGSLAVDSAFAFDEVFGQLYLSGNGAFRVEQVAAPVTLVLSAAAVQSETVAGKFAVTASRVVSARTDVSFTYGGTAVIGSDFNPANPHNIGGGGNDVSLGFINNAADTLDKTITVQFAGSSRPGYVLDNTAISIFIDDDENPRISFAAASSLNEEWAGIVEVPFTLSSPTLEPSSFGVGIQFDPAIYADDMTILTPTMTLPVGSTGGVVRIQIVDDADDDEPGDAPNLVFTNLDRLRYGTQGVHDFIIPPRPRLSFSTPSGSVAEDGTQTITLQVDRATAYDLAVGFNKTGGTAAFSDYTLNPEPTGQPDLIIPAGQKTVTFTLTSTPDVFDEVNETVILSAFSGSPRIVVSPGQSTFTSTILDDDGPLVSFGTPASNAVEAVGGFHDVEVKLSQASPQSITVPLTITGGTATIGSDYTLPNATVTFAPGETSRTVRINLIDDFVHEPDETITLAFGTILNAFPGSGTAHTVTLASAPRPLVEIGGGGTLPETGGSVTFLLTLGTPRITDFIVPFTLSGTAAAGDYILSAPHFFIPAGSGGASITLTATGDTTDEANETLTLTLGAPTPEEAVLGTALTATATILDDDGPGVRFATSGGAPILEHADSSYVTTVELTQPSPQDVIVSLSYAGGTATPGGDYTLGATTLTFPAGVTALTLTLGIRDDWFEEADETVLITITSATNADVAAPATHTLTLLGSEPARLTIPNVNFSRSEPGGEATFHVSLSKALPVDVTVPLIRGGSASDFDITAPSSVTIPAGQTQAAVTVTILDDGIYETTDLASFTLGTPDTLLAGSFDGGEAKVFIADNDEVPRVRIIDTSRTMDEAGSTTITFQLTTPSFETVNVSYTIAGTTSFDEYTVTGAAGVSQSGTTLNLQFLPGQTSLTATFTSIGDTLPEANETITLNGYLISKALFGVNKATILVVDDDRPTINFEQLNLTVPEDGVARIVRAKLTHVVNGVSVPYVTPVAITVPVTSNGATAGTEYVLSGNLLQFAAGSSSATITVTSPENTTPERTKTLTLGLVVPANVNAGTTTSMSVRLTDNDQPVVTVTPPSQSVIAENGGAKTVTVSLSAAYIDNLEVDFGFYYGFNLVYATKGSDFSTSATSVVIPVGATQATFTITPNNDTVFEGAEYIALSVRVAEVNATVPLSNTFHTIELRDDELQVSFVTTTVSLFEGNQSGVSVQLNAPAASAVSIPIAIVENTAKAGDVSVTTSTVTFAAGQKTATYAFTPIVDGFEGTENLQFAFGALPAGVTATGSRPTITINDRFDASFSTASSGGKEGDKYFIELILPGPAPEQFTVPYTGSGATLFDPVTNNLTSSDVIAAGYLGNSTTAFDTRYAVFAKGASVARVGIELRRDTATEGTEYLTLTLGYPTLAGVGLGGLTTHLITIRNGPAPSPPQGSSWNGLLAGGSTFLDANHNGVRDIVDIDADGQQDEGEPLEPLSLADYAGAFDLPYLKAADLNNDGVHTFNEGTHVSTGGTDLSTNAPLEVPLIAPPESGIVTALTSVMSRLMRLQNFALAAAHTRVQEAFGLTGIDLLTTHGVTGTQAADPNAIALKKAVTRLQTTTIHIAKLLSNLAGGPSMHTAALAVYDDLAARLLEPGSTFDPTLEGNVRAVLASVAGRFGLEPAAELLDGASTISAAVNLAVEDVVLSGTTDAYLVALAKVQTVAQVSAANALANAANGTISIATAVSAYTGPNLAAAISVAATGDVINPKLIVFPGEVIEGDSGERMLEFHVLLDRPSQQGVTVDWTTLDATATAGSDYIAANGTLTWAPNQGNAQTVWIRVTGDTLAEYDELVGLTLSNPVRATILESTGFGTIIADDAFNYTAPDDGEASELRLIAMPDRVYLSRNNLPVWDGALSAAVPVIIHGRDGRDDSLTVQADSGWLGGLAFHGGTGTDTLLALDGYLGAVAVSPGVLTYAGGESIAYNGVENVTSAQRGTVLPLPEITQVIVNGGSPNRSRITRIDLDFSAAVTPAGLGAVSLTRTNAAPLTLTAANGLLLTATSPTRVTLTFADIDSIELDSGSLADGYWQLHLPALNWQSDAGSTQLRRFFGDADNNGTVNALDLAEFGNAFGGTFIGSAFDFDNNGTVNALDLAEFGNRFGLTL